MIKLTRLKDDTPILINENYIATVEETPDTVVSLQNGNRYFVAERMDEILDKAVVFRRDCHQDILDSKRK